MFMLDHKGKLFFVTARHVAAALPDRPKFQLWIKDAWQDYEAVRKILPSNPDVDIAVLETGEKAEHPFLIAPSSGNEGPTLGQQVWFLGFPFGDTAMTSRMGDQSLPFMKRGTISAINATKPDAVTLYIDGFNNPGFSGGPIVYWDFTAHAYRLLVVVQGFRNDTAKVLVNGQQLDTNVLVNSGILTGYDIKHAIQAIDAMLNIAP